ncbi:MAG: Ig-like domain-containing protein [Gammaproteobacteria bacterium]
MCDGAAVALTPAALSNQTTATETPDLEAGESCTLTFASANLTDTDASDPPDNLDGDNNGLPGGDKTVTFGVRPDAVADSYTNVHTNIGLSVPLANGVLANDDLGDVSPATLVGWGSSAVNAQANSVAADAQGATAQGGLATVNADGSFDYDPPPGFTGTDNFFYHISNANGDHVGQVDLAVAGTRIWFINDTSPGSANLGTLQNPFTALSNFNGSANTQTGDFVHIEHNSAAYNGGITLKNNMTVIGEGATGSLPGFVASLVTISPFSPILPTLGGARPVLTNGSGDGVTLAATNTLRGFNVGSTSGAGISGSGAGMLMAAECSITGTGVGINVSDKTLAANFNDISSSNNSGILLNSVGGDFDVSNTVGSIINAGSNIAVSIVGSLYCSVSA